MELNFELIRRAKNCDYSTCLTNEFNVFTHRLNDKDLQKQSQDPKFRDTVNGVADIDSYFNDTEDNVFCPKYAPLPTKHFYQKYPDPVRYYLTETSNHDAAIHRNAHKTLLNFLRLRGIDIVNATFTKDKIREALFKNIQMYEYKLEQEKRLEELVCDLA